MRKLFRLVSFATLTLALAASAQAAGLSSPLISEIYFNPPGGNDVALNGLEYIELAGPNSGSLNNHYLVFLENENNEDNTNIPGPGKVERIFDLNGMSFGSNGYMVLAMSNSPYPAVKNAAWDIPAPANPNAPTLAESRKTLSNGAYVYENRAWNSSLGAVERGYGNAGAGLSSIQAYSENDGEIEASGFTAMLVYVDPNGPGAAPVIGQDLDLGNNGLDVATGQVGWAIRDSIGAVGEAGEQFSRVYAQNNFGPSPLEAPGGVDPGKTYVNTLPTGSLPGVAEVEYLGRVSTGQNINDWFVANLTDNAASGYSSGLRNYGISGNHAGLNNPEAYVGTTYAPSPFGYGTDITVTLGAPNVNFAVPGDSNRNGSVTISDFATLQNNIGKAGGWAQGDFNYDGKITISDFALLQNNFGFGVGAAAMPVPEPASIAMFGMGALAMLGLFVRRR